LDALTKRLESQPSLTAEKKLGITNAFKEKLGWKVPLKAGVTQYENNAIVDAYKTANNIK